MTRLWHLLHNCVAHPLLGLTGDASFAIRFHDWTARRAGFVPAERRGLRKPFPRRANETL